MRGCSQTWLIEAGRAGCTGGGSKFASGDDGGEKELSSAMTFFWHVTI
jgi:hypothetical protein